MSVERTFSIVKPDAVRRNLIGRIYARFESGGLQIIAARMIQLTRIQAQEFYTVHRERPFYDDLVEYMISGPVMVQVLEGENAIARNREIMAPPIPPTRLPERFAPILRSPSRPTRSMVQMGRYRPEEISFFFDDSDLCLRTD